MRPWLSLIVLVLNACSYPGGTPQAEPDYGLSEIDQPALHAIRSSELRELMDRMDILMQERFMTEHEVDIERRKYAIRIATTAEELSKTVNAILHVLPSLKLSSEERNAFLSLANKLDDQAKVLQKQAKQNQIDSIDNTMNQISATCTACHSLFRKSNK
ncbi:MAG: cytochrome c [Gammaproteobacteria bacterium]